MTHLTSRNKRDFLFDNNTYKVFGGRFMHYYSNPNFSLFNFLNTRAEANFGTIPRENAIIQQAKEFFALHFKEFINNKIYSCHSTVAQHHENLIEFIKFLNGENEI